MLRHALFVLLGGLAFAWPAVWNGYPMVFGDTAVYLLDGLTLHVSWPRPFFYGLAIVPLHLKLSGWPIVAAQGLAAAAVVRLMLAVVLPLAGEATYLAILAILAAGTSLPWFASQVMPDVFGPLIPLLLAPLILAPDRFKPWAQVLVILVAAGFTTFHQSYVPTLLACVMLLLALRWWRGRRPGPGDLVRAGAAPMLAIGLIVAQNAVFLGQVSFSPYGKLFVLARTVIEGPGERTLRRDCPQPGWTLCAQVGQFPDNVEAFQFGDYGSISRAGGHVVVAAQAGPILAATFHAEPGVLIGAAIRRSLQQFVSFATGDWLLRPKPDVDAAWARVFPPADAARYQAARQQHDLTLVPDGLQALHKTLGFAGMLLLPIGIVRDWRRRSLLAGLLITVAAALVVNAVVTGGLSGTYDRYQSRFVWLAVLAGSMVLARIKPQPARPAAR